ncbi:hypothetical protein SUBVAR_06481 [Subdoligranulum variabile DSM 15176]|uniref:Uncharacterized protein n=1 Tax=Subdoligranulum variabile DSM 15176 TaxID=411471 RepID=D1PQ14_9FIRM|nr:hypothetical protein SUBVAR_06481 [Subdoligranulum variabile DSM 15176]
MYTLPGRLSRRGGAFPAIFVERRGAVPLQKGAGAVYNINVLFFA